MIRHIFRKDARLLWPMAALVAALHVCAAVPRYMLDHGARTFQLDLLSNMLASLSLVGVMVLVVVAVHQDPVPGARQDWLVRPVRRADLALAKLLFIALLVLAPIWFVDVGVALANGFALPEACVAAAARNLQIFCVFALPAMMVGVITRTFVEAVIAGLGGFMLLMGFFQIFLALLLGIKASLGGTGTEWMAIAGLDLIALLGAPVVLALQYSARQTTLSRCLVGLGAAAVCSVAFLPWQLAFRMQEALAPQPMAARTISATFDAQAGRYHLPQGAALAVASALHLPLAFTGVPDDSSVLLDRADVRITAADGTTLYQGRTSISVDGRGSMLDAQFEVRAGEHEGPVHSIYQRIYLPTNVFARLKDRRVRMSVDYSMTLFGLSGTYSMPAVGARESLPGLGRCVTGIDAEGDDVTLSCFSLARQPSCASAHLEQPATGLRNPEAHFCAFPDYSPAFIAPFWPDMIHRMGGEARFFDRTGMVRFPIDGPKLATSRLIIQTFEPRDHFTRHIDTPVLRLADLTGLATAVAATEPSAPFKEKIE